MRRTGRATSCQRHWCALRRCGWRGRQACHPCAAWASGGPAARLAALRKLRRTVIDQNWDVDRARDLFRDRFDNRDCDDSGVPLGRLGCQAPLFPDDQGVQAVVAPDRPGEAGVLELEVAMGATPAVPSDDFLWLQERVVGVAPRMGCWHCWFHGWDRSETPQWRKRPPSTAARTHRHQTARLLDKPCRGHDVRIRHH